MISELMATDFGKVIAQKFTRYGIKDLLSQFTTAETVKAMNQSQGTIQEMSPADKLKFIQDEKARQASKILQIKKSLENGTLQGSKASVFQREVKIMERNLQYLQQDYEALFNKLESKAKEKTVQQIGDKISSLASKVIANLT